MVAPAALAAATSSTDFGSIPVDSITGATAACRVPPSVVKSFWYSMSTTAVRDGSMAGDGADMKLSSGRCVGDRRR